ncbi:MAG: rod shape-determining protein MreC [Chloroflexi bacterium]|nr:rod shape-determining protein MreC [Chloroflexota bacterium]
MDTSLVTSKQGRMRRRAQMAGAVLLLLLFLLLFVGVILGKLAPAGEFARWLVAPWEHTLSASARSVHDALTAPRSVDALRAENERLRREIERLTVEQVRFTEIEQENRRLRALLHFAEAHPYYSIKGASVVGQVIGRDPSIVVQRLILNVGELQGIAVGMPVVTDTGLVGQILRVHKNTSEVLPITARESAVNAIVQSSRLTGVVRGQDSNTLVMEYIPLDRPVQVGDLILTSGLGSVYPPKLVIGQVVGVQRHDYDMYQKAFIRPTVDFRRLEQVLVLTDFRPDPEIRSFMESLEGEETGP